MMNHQNEYSLRRQRLFEQMPQNSLAIIFTAPHFHRSADQEHHFYPDNDFYYFTGFCEPETAAIFIKSDKEGHRYILFNRPHDPVQEQWCGRRVGQQTAVEQYGADKAYVYSELLEKLTDCLADKESLYCIWGRYPDNDTIIQTAINQVRKRVRSGIKMPDTLINLEHLVHEMRLIKSPHEIDLMRKAAEISANAHIRAMQICRPGMNEYQLRAELIYEFQRNGCWDEAYEPIVGAGENGCILHYIENNQPLKDGDLVLIDAGGRYQYYDADLTSTFPINGKFSPHQKAIYDIVLEAQQTAFSKIKPGAVWSEMADAALNVIVQGLMDEGLLKGSLSTLIETQAYMPFYMHRIGHWLGMDVHDVGRYKIKSEWRKFSPGMVTTVEPGLYIKPGLAVDEKWWGMGVRIEDNVLITETGMDNLSKMLPRKTDDIEALMATK